MTRHDLKFKKNESAKRARGLQIVSPRSISCKSSFFVDSETWARSWLSGSSDHSYGGTSIKLHEVRPECTLSRKECHSDQPLDLELPCGWVTLCVEFMLGKAGVITGIKCSRSCLCTSLRHVPAAGSSGFTCTQLRKYALDYANALNTVIYGHARQVD